MSDTSTTFEVPYIGGTQLPWLRGAVVAVRWALVALAGIALLLDGLATAEIVALVLTAAFATWRTIGALGARASLRTVLILEALIGLIAVLLTDQFTSPFLPLLMLPLFTAGLGAGFPATMPSWFFCTAVIFGVQAATGENLAGAATGALLLLTPSVIGAIGRQMVLRIEEEYEVEFGRVESLEGVNELLAALTEQVRSLPVARKPSEVMAQVRDQIMNKFEPDAVALLIHERDMWRPVHVEGLEIDGPIPHRALPQPLLDRGPLSGPSATPFLRPGQGLSPSSEGGLYQWLWSRGQPIGLLALEYRDSRDLDRVDPAELERMSIPLALALDNSMWFERLHTLGVDEERQRIGAELHDRFAQSLAFIGLELDRAIRNNPESSELGRIRDHVRETLGELRETMRDLRVHVTEERSLEEILTSELERFGDRYGVMATLLMPEGGLPRLSLPVEQQFLRIVQELLVLAEREQKATQVEVWLAVDSAGVLLGMDDDGNGQPDERLGAEARQRLDVVRARADAIGAEVVRRATPGEGAATRVFLANLRPPTEAETAPSARSTT